MRRVRAAFVPLAVVLAAAGCYRSDVTVDVDEHGAGTFHLIAAVDRDAAARLRGLLADQSGGDAGDEDPFGTIQARIAVTRSVVPEGSEVEPYDEDGFCGIEVTFAFSSPRELTDLVARVDPEQSIFERFVLEGDGEAWTFEAVPASSLDTGGVDASGFETFLEDASNVVRMRIPGRQVEHNADRIDEDGTMIWDLDVLGDPRTLHARTEPGEPIRSQTFSSAGDAATRAEDGGNGSSAVLWIVLGVVLALAVVFALVLWQRTRTRPAPVGAGPARPSGDGPPPDDSSGRTF
ncbi:MAG TPA: hypothetical protein VF183_05185 [Acidimicrobiales bacterium]